MQVTVDWHEPKLMRRFWSKVAVTDPAECWDWNGGRSRSGHGNFNLRRGGVQIMFASRVAYAMALGDPGSDHVDHLCRNPACCNPLHLEAVTNGENQRRGLNGVLKATCANGHPWSEFATVHAGKNVCRLCARERAKAKWAQIKSDPDRLAAHKAAQRERWARRTGRGC